MPSASFIHAACFAIGTLVGGGIVSVIGSSRKRDAQATQIPTRAQAVPVTTGLDVHPAPAQLASALTHVTYPSAVLKYGNPGPISDQLVRKAYVAGYDRRLRHPAWTAEHLTAESLRKSPSQGAGDEKGDRSKSLFTEDQSLPDVFRAKLSDYFRSGYDRGHMVPAADAKSSQAAMDETFLLSNIAPQVGDGFNRHYWAYLEDWCRRLTNSFQDVYVFTVPLYLPRLESDGKWRVTHEVIGSPPNIAVPTHFAKVVLTSRPSSSPDKLEISTGAFVLPNAVIPDDAPLTSFVMPVEAVERASGLMLLPQALKEESKHICRTTKCEVIIRRFDDVQKRPEMRRAISSPR